MVNSSSGVSLSQLVNVFIASNAIILILNPGSTANNQDLVNEMYNLYPIYTFILSVILAPIIEELVFRFSIFRPIAKKNKTIAYIISVFTFMVFIITSHCRKGTQHPIAYLHRHFCRINSY